MFASIICDHVCIHQPYAAFYHLLALNNDFQADCSAVFRFLIGLSIPKEFCVCICMGYNGKMRTIFSC